MIIIIILIIMITIIKIMIIIITIIKKIKNNNNDNDNDNNKNNYNNNNDNNHRFPVRRAGVHAACLEQKASIVQLYLQPNYLYFSSIFILSLFFIPTISLLPLPVQQLYQHHGVHPCCPLGSPP
jgi:hypothetical protein